MATKARRASGDIEGSRIILRDAAGKIRILLDAGSENGFASINFFSQSGAESIEIGTQPGGAVVMSFNHGVHGMLTVSATGITLRSADGRLGVTLGRIVDDSDSLIVYRDGRPVWRSPSKEKPKAGQKPRRRRKP